MQEALSEEDAHEVVPARDVAADGGFVTCFDTFKPSAM